MHKVARQEGSIIREPIDPQLRALAKDETPRVTPDTARPLTIGNCLSFHNPVIETNSADPAPSAIVHSAHPITSLLPFPIRAAIL